MNSTTEEESAIQEALEFLEEELQEKKNFKTINKYGGKGGFGLVLFVEEMSDPSKKYAIKAQSIINTYTGKISNALLKACQDEAEMMRNCKHKNVVEIYSDFVIGFHHFIQMNLCESSLDDWISKNQQPINDMIFLHYANQMIDGLEYLHDKNFVLRDLSVRNILISTDGVIKLCDFGLAKKYDDTFKSKLLYTQAAKGVFFYFPPELFEDLKNNKEQVRQTKQGDIWALGICLSLLGGVKIVDFLHVQNSDFMIPESQYLSQKANQIVKYILNRNPEQRPSIKQIREYMFQLFLKNFSQEQVFNSQLSQKVDSKLNSQDQKELSRNSNQQTNYSQNSKDSQIQDLQSCQLFSSDSNYSNQFQELSSIKAPLSQISIERIIDFNFNEIEITYKKYQQYVKDYPNNIDVLLTLGFIELKYNFNLSNSKQYFEQCLELKNDEVDAYLGLCQIIAQAREYNNFDKASIYLQKCLKMRKDYWRIYYIKSCLCYWSTKYEEGIAFLKQGLELNNNSIQLLSLKMQIHTYLEDYEEAKNILQKIEPLNVENDPIVLYRIAYCYRYAYQDIIKAIYYSKKSLEVNSKDLQVLINLIGYLKKQDLKEEAQDYQTKAELLYPQNSILLNYLGENESDEDKKQDLFKKSIQIDSKNQFPYINLGKLLRKQEKFDDALKQFEKVLTFDPDNISANDNIGIVLGFDKKEYHKAIPYLKNAIQTVSKETYVHENIAQIYIFMEDYQNATIYLNQGLQINPKIGSLYSKLAQIEKNKKNDEKYLEYKLKQIEVDPKDEDCLDNLGYYYGQKKDSEKSKFYYLKLQELNPNYRFINYNLGISSQDNKQKLEYYENEIKQNPQYDQAYDHIGCIYYNKKNFDLAIEYFQKAIKINDQNYIYFENLADSYKNLKQNEMAVENYKKAILLENNNGNIFENLANLQYEMKQFENAEENYKKAIQIKHQSKNLYENLANTYKELKKYKQAIEYYEKQIEYDPNSDNCYFQIAYLEDTQNNNKEKSLKYNKKAIELNPTGNSNYYKNAGHDSQDLKQYKQASEYFLKAISMDQNKKILYKNLANIEKEQFNNTQKALEYLEKIQSELTDSDIRTYYKWYVEAKNVDKARELLQKIIKNNPQDKDNIFQLGQLEFGQKNYHKAIKQYQKATEIDPKDHFPIFNIGSAYFYLEDYDKALEYYYKTIKVDPNYQLAYHFIGRIEFEQKKDPKKAIKFLRKSIELDNEYVWSYYYLGKAFNDRKYPSEAVECFQKLLEFSPNFSEATYCKDYIKENKNAKKKTYKQTNVDDSDCNIF